MFFNGFTPKLLHFIYKNRVSQMYAENNLGGKNGKDTLNLK